MRHQELTRCLTFAVLLALSGCGQSGSAPEGAATGSEPAAESSSTSSTSASAPAKAPAAASTPAPAPKPIVIPAGTVIEVTVDQTLSSKTSNEGEHFDASLAAPVVVDGKRVIPSGVKASGIVTSAKSAGRFKGNAELSVVLSTIVMNGRTYNVDTDAFTEASKGRGKRTAIGAGAGAAAGVIIGAIAGGGKGAAIGAGAGAGAGTAGAAVTGERDVTIPAETKISFRLTQSVEVRSPAS